MSRTGVFAAGLLLLLGGPGLAESYSCPIIQTGPEVMSEGAQGIWQMVDLAAVPGSGGLIAIEIFDGQPAELFQLAPEVTVAADGNTDLYDLSDVSQPFIRCRYDGVEKQFVLAVEPDLSSCKVMSQDGMFQPTVRCE